MIVKLLREGGLLAVYTCNVYGTNIVVKYVTSFAFLSQKFMANKQKTPCSPLHQLTVSNLN